MAEGFSVNPEPLGVAKDRDERVVNALLATRGRSREDRLRVWLALGGDRATFDEENPPEEATEPDRDEYERTGEFLWDPQGQ